MNIVSGRASLAVDKLAGAAMIGPEPEEEEEETTGTTDGRTGDRGTGGVGAGGGATAVIVVVVIVVLVVLGYFLFGKKKGGKKGEIKFSKAELKKL